MGGVSAHHFCCALHPFLSLEREICTVTCPSLPDETDPPREEEHCLCLCLCFVLVPVPVPVALVHVRPAHRLSQYTVQTRIPATEFPRP